MAISEAARLNDTFEILTHPHRRYVLYYLTTKSEVVDTGTLVTAIQNWEGGPPGMDQSDDREDISIALHHLHLPKLADAGIIRFDANAGSVELEETDGLDPFLVGSASIDVETQTSADD